MFISTVTKTKKSIICVAFFIKCLKGNMIMFRSKPKNKIKKSDHGEKMAY